MYRPAIHITPKIFTRRALVSVIESQPHGHDRKPVHRASARPHGKFPLTLVVGLMTIGVILVISLVQLLASWLG